MKSATQTVPSLSSGSGHSPKGSLKVHGRTEAQPPGAMLAELAAALRVSLEGLLGTRPVADKNRPKTASLLKRLRRVDEPPAADERAALKTVEALLEARRRNGRR